MQTDKQRNRYIDRNAKKNDLFSVMPQYKKVVVYTVVMPTEYIVPQYRKES